jgi:hypothetical protein
MSDQLINEVLSPLILILASPFFFITAIKIQRRKRFFQAQGIAVEGVIVRIDEKKEEYDDYTRLVPALSFMTVGQQWVTVPCGENNVINKFETGQIVAILYNPTNHTDFVIVDDEKAWLEILFMLVGVSLLLAGVIWLV